MTAQIPAPAPADSPVITERDMLGAMEVLATTAPDPAELLVLTDEELLGTSGTDALDLLGGPYVTQDGIDRDASVAAALRSLAARHLLTPLGGPTEDEGDVVVGEAGEAPRAFQLDRGLAGVTTLRRIPEAMVHVERTLAGGTTRLAHYLFPADGVLEEYVTIDGFHHFSVPPLAEVPQRLARFVDPFEDATTDGTEREVSVPGAEVETTFADARSLSVVTSILDGDGARATVCAVPGSLLLLDTGPLDEATTDAESTVGTLGEVSPATLRAALAALVPVVGGTER